MMTPPPLPAPAVALEYVARTSVLEKPRTFSLTSDALILRVDPQKGVAPAPEVMLLRDIVHVRLRYFPTRVQTNRYECILRSRTGHAWKITNQVYLGPMSFRDQSAGYRAFVHALVERIARANPAAQFVRGTSTAGYYGSIAFCGAMFLLLAIVILSLGPTLHWVGLVKLAFLLTFAPILVGYVRKNRPRPFEPHAVPPDIVPDDAGDAAPPDASAH